jgi:hypothetical protein
VALIVLKMTPHRRQHNGTQDHPFHGVETSNSDNRFSVLDHARTPQNSIVEKNYSSCELAATSALSNFQTRLPPYSFASQNFKTNHLATLELQEAHWLTRASLDAFD